MVYHGTADVVREVQDVVPVEVYDAPEHGRVAIVEILVGFLSVVFGVFSYGLRESRFGPFAQRSHVCFEAHPSYVEHDLVIIL